MTKWAKLLILALVATALVATTACENMGQSAGQPAATAETGHAAAPMKKEGTELAKVGDSVITVEEFEGKLEKIPPFYKKKLATIEGKKEFLDRMVMEELYYLEAMRQGLDTDAEYLEQMENIRRNLLATKIKRKILEEDVTPTPEEIQQYYEEHKADKFQVDESLKLRHILVRVSRKATADEEAKAQAKAEKALASIKGGRSFEDVAGEFSEDKYSAKKGGEIPPVRKGVKSKEFEDAAWKLAKPGEISPVFKDRRGYNILQFVEKVPADFKEFDKVERQIQRTLENEKRKAMLDEFNADLKNKSQVTIHEELLAEIGPSDDDAPAAPGAITQEPEESEGEEN